MKNKRFFFQIWHRDGCFQREQRRKTETVGGVFSHRISPRRDVTGNVVVDVKLQRRFAAQKKFLSQSRSKLKRRPKMADFNAAIDEPLYIGEGYVITLSL